MTTSAAHDAAAVASALPLDHPLAQIARLRLDAHVRAERNTMKIKSPNKAFNGVSVGVDFVDGVAETSDPAAINYFRSAGYEVDGVRRVVEETTPVIDPRDVEVVQIGQRLNDAAAKGV